MKDPDDKDLTYIPFEKASAPGGGFYFHYVNRWWSVHPDRGLMLFYGDSAQCNSNEATARRLQQQLYPWAEVRFIPSAFVPIDPRDFA